MNIESSYENSKSPGPAADIAFACAFGLVAVLTTPFAAIAHAAHMSAIGVSTPTAARALVFCILAAPIILYFSVFAAIGAQATWASDDRHSDIADRLPIGRFVSAIRRREGSLASAMRNGVYGCALGLAAGSIVVIAFQVIFIIVALLGPGIVMILADIAVMIGVAAAAATWGAIIGALLYIRRHYGWAAAFASAAAVAGLSNLLVWRCLPP